MIVLGTIDVTSALGLLAILGGITGAIVAIAKIGPERTNTVVTYQSQVLDDLAEMNTRLSSENTRLLKRIEALETRIKKGEEQRYELERRLRDLEREVGRQQNGH